MCPVFISDKMSRQEVKAYGRQEFRSFPLITSDPLPETLHDYIQDNLMGKGGVHMTNTNKHLQCEKTAKTYMFWDNVMLHYKKLWNLMKDLRNGRKNRKKH